MKNLITVGTVYIRVRTSDLINRKAKIINKIINKIIDRNIIPVLIDTG